MNTRAALLLTGVGLALSAAWLDNETEAKRREAIGTALVTLVLADLLWKAK